MPRRAAACIAALALAGCALAPPVPPAPGGFAFGVMGETPYNAREEQAFAAMLARMDAAPLAFEIHVGDIKAGNGAPCTDTL